MKHNVILASGSKTRADLLRSAGVVCDVIPAKIDEAAIKASLLAEGAKPNDIVDALAEYKALRVVGKNPSGLVIGSDQILVCEKQIYDKANTMDGARDKLLALRGKPHQLLSAAVIFENGKPVWRTIGRAQLFMRDFSDEFLDGYLERGGTDLLQSVGCYFLESEGVQLFSRIQGDYFTVLGFPLLEVVDFLRTRGVIET
ncbi:Maf/YceF/YhdE family protein [Amylibacter kogurei]|uniref:Nucleoside triphosphate pyrophosphatase n=1 Tax=Paramylibacter kogurei TaxID=1889778 RepID=A0A2G5KAM4_9RHOB|nr:Maf family protein [Amylibacter kogurei]PIB26567.1 Maf/YceF/YhdE family protein [Amylibacter kogurei]